MAHKTVQLIIGQILTDEELRSSFLEQPLAALQRLRDRGLELTAGEMDALIATDRRLWRWGAQWIDSSLQRCRLNGVER